MKGFPDNFIRKALIPFSVGIFLFGCAAVEKVTQPTAKSTSPTTTGPAIEQTQKEAQPTPQPQPPPQATLPPQPTVVTPSTTVPPATVRVAQVTVPSENLRDGPGGKVVGKVTKGTSLEILEDKGNWLRVRLEDGKEAWIWKASTSEEAKTSPSPTTQPTAPKGKSPM